ncbi:MAG: AAA family ATPase, partial [Actinomycetota bacterium]|nr:AAA family ATPase [Actinomycetota bacterium]
MPPASPERAAAIAPDDSASDDSASADPGAILAAEREHLSESLEFLRLMREDVLSLRALGGDPVSEGYLKAGLYRRAEALKDIPGTPLFFGRVDYAGAAGVSAAPGRGSFAGEQFHIGRRHVHDQGGQAVVVDWRAPVSRPFYRAGQTESMGLRLRRRFGFSGADLTAYEDEQFGGTRPAAGAVRAGAGLAGAG